MGGDGVLSHTHAGLKGSNQEEFGQSILFGIKSGNFSECITFLPCLQRQLLAKMQMFGHFAHDSKLSYSHLIFVLIFLMCNEHIPWFQQRLKYVLLHCIKEFLKRRL